MTSQKKKLVGYALLAVLGIIAAAIAVSSSLHTHPDIISDERPGSDSSPTISLPTSPVTVTVDELHELIGTLATDLAKDYPQSPEALHTAAMIRFELLQPAEAERLWRACLACEPDHLPARIGLAVLATDRGSDEEAVEVLRTALQSGYAAPEIYHRLGIALSQLGRLEEAEELLQQGAELFPRAAEVQLLLGQTLIREGKVEAAEKSLRNAAALAPRDPNPQLALAGVYARLGKTEEAAQCRRRFAELKGSVKPSSGPFESTFLRSLRRIATTYLGEAARVHAAHGNLPVAIDLLLRAISLEPDRQRNYVLLADACRRSNRWADAQAVLLRLTDLAPHDLQARLELAEVSAELGDVSSAEEAFSLVLQQRPDAVAAYNGLASLDLIRGDLASARSYAEEGIRWQPTAEGYGILARVFQQLGEDDSAEAALAQARALAAEPGPESPGGTLEASGDGRGSPLRQQQ